MPITPLFIAGEFNQSIRPHVSPHDEPTCRSCNPALLSRIFPRGAAVLLAMGTVLSPVASQLSLTWEPKIAIPTGLALAWLGYALMTQRQPAAAPLDGPLAMAAA